MRVEVYRNLHKQCWSVRALEGKHKGRVILHTHTLALKDAKFVVQKAGREKVLHQKRKNVHAFIRGTVHSKVWNIGNSMKQVSYNPYKADYFYTLPHCGPIYASDYVELTENKVFAL